MVIMDLGVCPNMDLEPCRLVWTYLAKVGKLTV